MAGELERAETLFDRITGCANDLGLLAEEIDPGTGELLGNFPQAFSHIGVITAAWQIDQARERAQARDRESDRDATVQRSRPCMPSSPVAG